MPSPALTRRALIAAAGTTIASAAIAVPYVSAAHSNEGCGMLADPTDDLLLGLIDAYRRGLDAFNAFRTDDDDERDAFAAVSYQPPMKILDDWGRPAVSLQGAIEALRLAVDENHDFAGSDMVGSLLYAALAYFDPATA